MPYESIYNDRAMREALGNIGEIAKNFGDGLHIAKNGLNGGELDPGMGARFDQTRYMSGSHELLNMVPMPCGGITKRPGFEHMASIGRPAAVSLMPFIFSASESRMLLLEHDGESCKLRVFRPDGTGGGVECELPYGENELEDISFAQSGDIIYLAHPGHAPAKIMRYGDHDWRFETIDWMPSMRAPGQPVLQTVGGIPSGETARTSQTYVVTAVDGSSGEESLPSPAARLDGVAPLSSTYFIEVEIEAVEGASEYRVYRRQAGVFGYVGRVVEAGEDGRLVFEDRNIAPDDTDTPPNWRDPFADGNYPSIVFLHQQRLGFAASARQPLTVWLSQTGSFESMAASIPPDDDDAIEATLAAPQANRILWAVSDRSALAIGTEGGEWLLTAAEGAALSPRDLSFQPQTYYGSQPGIPVLRAGSGLLFIQRGGSVAREFGYSFTDDRYQSTDLSLLARHILRGNPVASWCWQPEPLGIAWCALEDGAMAGLTYMREHDVIAWHRHETSGKVVCLASMPGPDGMWQVWAVTRRDIDGGPFHVERLKPFYLGGDFPQGSHLDGRDNSPFSARCVPALADTTIDNGSTFLRIKKINAVKARVINSKPFKCFCRSQGCQDSPLMNVPARPAAFAAEADWACPLAAGFRDNARLHLVFDGPDPVTILGITITLEISSGSGSQK